MKDKEDRIRLERGQWYGWQMWPGYTDAPYASPILVYEVTPLKTGGSRLKLVFDNVLYAQGVQGFELTLRVMARRATYLMAELEGYAPPRDVIISAMTRPWLEALCPSIEAQMPGPKYGTSPFQTQQFLTQFVRGAHERHLASP